MVCIALIKQCCLILKHSLSLHSLPQCFLISPKGFQPQAPDLFAKDVKDVTWKCVCPTPDDDQWKDNSWHWLWRLRPIISPLLSLYCLSFHSLTIVCSPSLSFSLSLNQFLFSCFTLSLSISPHISLHIAQIKRGYWYWETIKVWLAVGWMFLPFGKWYMTSSVTSDRGSCFEPSA